MKQSNERASTHNASRHLPVRKVKTNGRDAVAVPRNASDRRAGSDRRARDRATSAHVDVDDASVVAARVLVVIDHSLMRDAVARVLTAHDVPVHAVTVDSIEAAAVYAETPFDLILLDLNLPGFNNIGSLTAIREQRPEAPVVVLAATDDSNTVMAAIDGGAMGFISKRSDGPALAKAVSVVLSGGVFVPELDADVSAKPPHKFRRRTTDETEPVAPPHKQRRRASDVASSGSSADEEIGNSTGSASGGSAAEPTQTLDFTPRQTQVLSLLIKGLCNKSICRQLSLSENTVKTHIAAIFRTLGVHNRTAAVIEMSRKKGYHLS